MLHESWATSMSPVLPLPQWIAANPEPDPQALAERYGGYSRVPVEEWSRLIAYLRLAAARPGIAGAGQRYGDPGRHRSVAIAYRLWRRRFSRHWQCCKG